MYRQFVSHFVLIVMCGFIMWPHLWQKIGDKTDVRWNVGRCSVVRAWNMKVRDLAKAVVCRYCHGREAQC
jgi:hypothetical protein